MIHLLDDFRDTAAVARNWSAFSDRVMGGVSVAHVELVDRDGRRALRLWGHVSLERNGGFIQMARQFPNGTYDASAFSGVQLSVCGAPGPYFVHLRTADTRAPWQYYAAQLAVTTAWHEVYLPFAAFTPVSLAAPLDVRTIQRIGIVAGTQAFDADLAVARVELVP
ncbi:MAG: CIA30 family protein [Gemmatimonas sp.]|uniref:CIA30 family protein n=1 Tax=Gemmatimonas sp. TaxID=1962908 RepID=UPI00391D2D93